MFDTENDRAGNSAFGLNHFLDFLVSRDEGNELDLVKVRGRVFGDKYPVPKHADAVCDCQYLLEAV